MIQHAPVIESLRSSWWGELKITEAIQGLTDARLGYHVGFAPEARVAHHFSGSVGSESVDARVLYAPGH